eukprot:2294421-Rhodomonas_salina.1
MPAPLISFSVYLTAAPALHALTNDPSYQAKSQNQPICPATHVNAYRGLYLEGASATRSAPAAATVRNVH